MLDEVLGRHLMVDHELSHREYEVLVRLDGHGGRMRMSVMAQQIVASPALMTQTIAKLEARGLVEREAAASGDRRGVDAVLLPCGRELLQASATDHASIIIELLLDRIGDERMDDFTAAIGEVADHLRAHRRSEPCDISECPAKEYS